LQKSSHRLTEEACLVKMFKYFDIHERGFVSLSDFMKTMEKIGLYYHQAELQPLFENFYATGS
jgi:Ca2+-binding EF-hand superfamily protein